MNMFIGFLMMLQICGMQTMSVNLLIWVWLMGLQEEMLVKILQVI